MGDNPRLHRYPHPLSSPLLHLPSPNSSITAAAYIILGISAIGREIENPFGDDVNDLPLDTYCRRIAQELDIITAMPPPSVDDFGSRDENLVFFPHSTAGYPEWKERSVQDIRSVLKTRVMANAHSPLNTPNASTIFGAASPSLGSRQCLSPEV